MEKNYDLEERTFQFARSVCGFCKEIPKNTSNIEYSKQVIRSSGSIGANYIEANESFSKKDFLFRIKICRKEAKETIYWLRLISETNSKDFSKKSEELIDEATQLKKILSAILEKSQ